MKSMICVLNKFSGNKARNVEVKWNSVLVMYRFTSAEQCIDNWRGQSTACWIN